MKRITKALRRLHSARPETEMWSVRVYSDRSGCLVDDSGKSVPDTNFLDTDGAVLQIDRQAKI